MIDEMATLLNARHVEMTACCIKSFDEISDESKSMLIKVGWKKDFIEKLTKETSRLTKSGWQSRQHSRSTSLLEVDRGETDDRSEADLYQRQQNGLRHRRLHGGTWRDEISAAELVRDH